MKRRDFTTKEHMKFTSFTAITTGLFALQVIAAGASMPPQAQSSTHVTAGKFVSKAAHVSGLAEIIEKGGKRFLTISHLVSPKCHVLIVKLENITDDKSVKASTKIDLGATASSHSVTFPLSKEIDVWQFRSLSLWDAKTGQSFGIAELRSDQEKN